MALAKKSKLESAIEDLGSEESRLNKGIDGTNVEIKANAALPVAREEIEPAVREKIRGGADRYRTSLEFELHRRAPSTIDLMPVWPLDDRGRMIGGEPNIRLLVDGFYFLLQSSPAAIDSIVAAAPAGGITAAEREKIAVALETKKFGLEQELENLYSEMEAAGFTPHRRVDLSPKVFLNFVNSENWNLR